jgi:hypothetical protein
MKIVEKIILIISLIIVGGFFIYFNLEKGVIATGFEIFSIENIIITALVFIVGVPIVIVIQRVINKNNKP